MGKKSQYCIYCGEREATERDHVPPKCFFPEPWPNDLITVPSCNVCNREYGRIDEYVRNIFVSLDVTEKKPELATVREKMHRSFLRKQSAKLLFKIYTTLVNVDIISKNGILLDKRKAFNLDREEFNKFFERLGRALLFIENDFQHFNGRFEWNELVDYKQLPLPIRNKLENDIRKSNANGLFKYSGIWKNDTPTSIWFVKFFNSIEFRIYIESV